MYDKHRAVTKAVQEVHNTYELKFEVVKNTAKDAKIKLLEDQQKERDEKDKKIFSLNTQLSNSIRMLSVREKRSSAKDSGESPSIGVSCTGRELFQEDGEFLIREATRADKVVVERDYYYEQYEKARLMIKGINNGN